MTKTLLVVAGAAAIAALGWYFSHSRFTPASAPSSTAASNGFPSRELISAAPNPSAAPLTQQAGGSAPASSQPAARDLNPHINPYAAALREPGKNKRAWDGDFLKNFAKAAQGDPIRFELCAGQMAAGRIKITQFQNGELNYLSGELTEPEPGKFFFLTPPAGGKAGKAVGVIEFPASGKAYRIEPTGPDGAPELWERRLSEVLCLNMPPPQPSATNEPANIPPLRPDLAPNFIPSWNSNIISLQSYPGSPAVLLLDFFGGYTPTWGGITYSRPNVNNDQIKDLWKRVAEDFMPFNINVTTDIRVYQAAPANSRQRCAYTDTPVTAAGVAYIGSWNWGNDTPCWSVYTSGKAGAEVGAHEAGHTLILYHQTQDFPDGSHNEYFGGHGSGPTGWAPTMGVGYYQPATTWARGEYEFAGNTEDELAIVVNNNNNVDYRTDDTGATLATSRYLELYTGNTASAQGVIERTSETDAFQFTTSGGAVSLTASPVGDWGCLAMMATLADASDTVIASNNPQNALTASISTNLPAGRYTFRVTGAGRNNPAVDGFTAYASLGYYSVTGTVAGARLPNRFNLAEHSTNGTLAGTIPATNPGGDPLVYAIISGNTGNTFSLDNAGALRVASNVLLNYETLALSTMLAVQFELFVNITNTVNPSLTELNRRVVIAVTNVNERPTLAGFNVSVLEHTQSGTLVGQAQGDDPDFYTDLRYSIVGGNSNSMFSLNATNGSIFVAGDLNTTNQTVFNLRVAVSDQATPTALSATSTVVITVVSNGTPFQPGTISYATYDNINGGAVSDLTNAAVFPRDPAAEKRVALFEGDTDRADNFGAVLRGYLMPPASGNYTFWIASDDNSQLWLSASTNPASATVIASVPGYTGPREWTKFTEQQSAAISLTAGQGYYIEARMKEGNGGDNVAVAWQCASAGISRDVIPGRFVAPYFMNYVPRAAGFTYNLHRDAITGARLGTVAITDVNPSDDHRLAIVSGNADGIFVIDSISGVLRVENEAALRASGQTSYTLQVRVVDDGSPQLSGTATVRFNLVATNAITASSVRQEVWNSIGGGNAVSDLTGNARFPGRADALRSITGLNSGQNIGDNYGSRVRALLRPSTSGDYTFFIASDDSSQLNFSPNTDPAQAAQIAYLNGSTGYQNWTANASQRSAPITLVAGQSYYLEALHKEGGGQDHVAVAWAGPGLTGTNVIDAAYLTAVDLSYPPVLSNKTALIAWTAPNGATVTTVTATDSSLDTIAYKILSGNTGNTFALDPDTGRITVADRTQFPSASGSYSLLVQAQDSGCGGLYPLKSTQAVVTVFITGTNWPPVIALNAPANGALLPAPIALAATASDANNNLSRVEFYADGSRLGQFIIPPFNFTWTNAPLGPHSVFAVAVDTSGASATSVVAHFTVVAATTNTLIASGSDWRYFDRTNNLGAAWRLFNWPDANWSNGLAMLGFGDANGLLPTTEVASNQQWTTYFRCKFTVPDASLISGLNARLMRDDGAVVYLNNFEVWRENMPDGLITNATPARASIGGAAESTWLTTNLSPARLVTGNNILAVEMHQINLTSSDLAFDFELAGVSVTPLSNVPPAIFLTQPAWGTLLAPASVVTLRAEGYDYDGPIAKVEFFNEGAKLAEVTNTPFQCAVSNLPLGECYLSARATDHRGGTATSDPVWVQVLPTTPLSFIPTGAVWKYLDNGSDQGTNWQKINFDDSAWGSGRAQLGYGDDDEATPVDFGSDTNNKYITTYFRHSFVLDDPSLVSSLTARVLRDDGVIAYLNGVEFFRNNMPLGPVSWLTLASGACADDGSVFFPANINPGLLVPSANVIAVEIHQASGNSSDISFDFELTGSSLVLPPPILSLARSGPGFELSWPAASGNLALFTTTALTPPISWTLATNQPVFVSGQWVVPLPATTNATRFYRLQAP